MKNKEYSESPLSKEQFNYLLNGEGVDNKNVKSESIFNVLILSDEDIKNINREPTEEEKEMIIKIINKNKDKLI